MTAMLQNLKQRFTDRPDTEHLQALLRITIIGLVLGPVASAVFSRPNVGDALKLSLIFLSVEFAIAFALIVWIRRRPTQSDSRRVLGMIADYGLMGIGMYLLGEALVLIYVIMLWVTIGYSLRYGARFPYVTVGFATATFLLVTLGTHYWFDYPSLSLGLLVGLIAIPPYLGSQLRVHVLTRAVDAATRANQAKNRFLAQMSHEFRTPLNGIIGMSDLLAAAPLSPRQRESFEVIQTSAWELLALVEDVLDISTIEAGKFRRNDADFRLSEVLRDIHVMLQPSALAKGLVFEWNVPKQIPDMLHGDCGRLRQVLINLLSNAIKFTERGKVSLDLALDEIDEAQVRLRLSVRDTGIGIPAEALERIFEAFEQVDSSRTRRYGGAGLGTTIAKVLTELLGGSIGVESREGAGSHFWIVVPFDLVESADSAAKPAPAEAEPAPAQAEPAPAQAGALDDRFAHHRAHVRSMRILVVDDLPSNRMMVCQVLEEAGHQSQMVDNGAAALDAIQQQGFDAVLLDLHMPRLSGTEVMRQVGLMQAGRERTPFIVLTADTTPEARLKCERAGAFAVLTKPLLVERLLEKLAEVATGSKQQAPNPSAVGADGEALISWAVLDGLAKLDHGEDFIPSFIVESVRDARKCIADLELAGATAHWDDFRDHCHGLKSAASCIGAVGLVEAAADTVRLPDGQLSKEWRARARFLRQSLEATIAALRQRFEGIRFEGDPEP